MFVNCPANIVIFHEQHNLVSYDEHSYHKQNSATSLLCLYDVLKLTRMFRLLERGTLSGSTPSFHNQNHKQYPCFTAWYQLDSTHWVSGTPFLRHWKCGDLILSARQTEIYCWEGTSPEMMCITVPHSDKGN